MTKEDLLVVEGVRKTFGGLVALDKVNMKVKKQLLVMLIGPNGSGKTTLINVVSGIYKPDEGKVTFDGHDITHCSADEVCRKGMVRTFQIPQLFTKLTVLENVLAAYKENPGTNFLKACVKKTWVNAEKEATEKAFEILNTVGLSHMWDKRASELSGGQMKLLETARALMSGAKMILMDEPAAGVYPSLIDNMFKHFVDLKKKLGITFLIIEHRLEPVLPYVDYVYAMDRGNIISEGKPKEVLNDEKVIESYLGE
ncbi:MAG: ABC transporter ATP-binding protein [Hadesarchaea archaeon]|nr:ABC transporter ATP-binding protein [Hadesarchaea archaeon]